MSGHPVVEYFPPFSLSQMVTLKTFSICLSQPIFISISVPTSSPEDVAVQLFNSTSALLLWGPPNSRDLNGDLQGYKVIVGSQNTSAHWFNFTLDSEVTSLQLDNLTAETEYWVKIAAYNRQGMGPFSKSVDFKVDPTLLFQHPVHQYPGNRVLQEIWFVALVSILAVAIIVAFVATVCIQRKKTSLKNIGHYNGKKIAHSV